MGIKRTWKLTKLSTLSLPVEIREDIIQRVVQRQGRHPITLYAWQVKERVAVEAFPTKAAVLGDWARRVGTKLLGEGADFPESIRVVRWPMEINAMISHITEGKLKELTIPKNGWKVLDLPLPSTIREELGSIAAKAGVKRS